ncbi:MAG: PAS domain S-box protein, partial [Planctomycetota bacterium]|nr:PAS domain S-box protein [Planctomycetota bacterium]
VDVRCGESGQAQEVVGTVQDITERKQAEEELRRYETAVEASGNFILAVDRNYRSILVNDAYLKRQQKKRQEIVGRTVVEVLGEEVFRQKIKPILDRCFAGELVSYEMTHEYPELGLRDLSVQYFPIGNGQGAVTGAVAIIDDITVRRRTELAIRDSEAELSAIYENAPFMMFLLDEEGRVHKANRAAARFSDRNADETVELTHGDALRCVNSMQDPRGCGFGESCQYCTVRTTAQDTIENGHTNRGVEALIQVGVEGKQEELNFLVSSGPVEVSGRQMSLLCMEDITERKMAENALRFSEGRFRKLVENSYDGISIFNRISDGRASRRKLNYCNQQYVKMSGRTREELMAADDIGEFLLDQRPSLQNADDTGRLNSSLAVMGISSWKRPDDLENYHEWVMVPLVIEDEPLIMSIDRDITESKLAEDAVQESEEKFRALFEEAPDSVLLIDTEKGEIVDFNDRAHERLGYTRKEFQKLELDDIEAVESPEEVAVHIEKVAKDGRDSFETKHRT